MPSYITRDHVCPNGHTTIYMHERDNESEIVECEVCGELAGRVLTASVVRENSASYVDGTRRFDGIREQRKVEREFKKARRQGRKDDTKKLRKELSKVQGTVK